MLGILILSMVAYFCVGAMYFGFVAWLVTRCKDPDAFIKQSVYPMVVKYFGVLSFALVWGVGYLVNYGDLESVSGFLDFVNKSAPHDL